MASYLRRGATVVSLSIAASILAALPSVGTPTWLSAVSDVSAGDASRPVVKVAADGTATAIWTRISGTGPGGSLISAVQTSARTAGGAWTTPVDLSPTGIDSGDPDLAVAADGSVLAAFSVTNGPNRGAYMATRVPGGGWSTPVAVALSGSSLIQQTRVAVGLDGTAVIAWQLFSATGYTVQASVRPPGGSWSPPATLSAVGLAPMSNSLGPQVAVGPDGAATVIWRQTPTADNYVVQTSTRPAVGSFGTATNLSATGPYVGEPRMAAGSDGTLVATWNNSTATNATVESSTRPPGGDWTTAQQISPGGVDTFNATPVIAADGTLTVVWGSFSGNQDVQAVRRAPGGAWGTPVTLSAPGVVAVEPTATSGPYGVTAVWSTMAGSASAILSSTFTAATGWSPAVALSPGGGSIQPRATVASGADGTTTVVWTRNGIVQARTLDGGGPALTGLIAPPTGSAGKSLSYAVTATDAWSNPTTVTWDFGDGSKATGAAAAHAYANPGTYTVTVVATDAVGNTTTRTASTAISARLKITAFKLTKKKISVRRSPKATKAKIAVNAAAKVTLKFKRKGTKKAVQKTYRVKAGKNVLKIRARLSKKLRLKPGTYRITATAKNATGRSNRAKVRLRIVR